ncbi:MAG TPA: tryptophan 2,3-dioxygenase family protein [Acidimicrobiales bacterium]|nr:tryptophan 2,3-dioxygenase family protein [Acidimicrobiales bacterium]
MVRPRPRRGAPGLAAAVETRRRHPVGTPDDDRALTYSRYLALDELLAAQRPLSDEHDELLFIVIHQVYELWFKELLHELAHLRARLEDGDTAHSLHTLKRILTILKVAVAQIDVLETMTPRQFTGFRARLQSSSGFQSAQFRELERTVGPPLFSSFVAYLEGQGYPAGDDLHAALLAAYRDDGEPAQVAERLVDLDEGLQEWRYRHVKMVERTIGDLPGTGGSAGVAYLRTTLFRPAFPDLWAIRSRL